MKKASLVLVLLAVAATVIVFSGEAEAGAWFGAAPWDTSFQQAGGREVISAASAMTGSDKSDVVVLLEEGRYSFDSQGRCNSTYRVVYRILTSAGASKWSSIESHWSPWHQERPTLRARVVTPDGVEHQLSQETISDAPDGDDSPDVFSDGRVVRAPLPALTAGAVVEQEVTTTEKIPFFAAGQSSRFFFGRSVKTYKTRLVLEAPADRPLRHVIRLLPDLDVTTSEQNGRIRRIFESGVIEPLQPLEPNLLTDVPRWPEVAFTTGKSWDQVATSYGAIVDQQIGRSAVKELVNDIVGESRRREFIVPNLLAYLRKKVRYAGLEFGNGSIVPRPPSETLKQGYGDCKDQAALLVAMLRAAGVPAFVALLQNGFGYDVDPALPGLGGFNHAIVYIPGAPSLWIDPTDPFTPAGQLPLGDQGRRALIAAAGFDSLTVTPEAKSADNRYVETREFLLSEQGGAKITETTRTFGSVAADYRDLYSADADAVRKRLQKYTEEAYLAKEISRLELSDPKDVGKPFTIRLEVNPKEGFMGEDRAVVTISPVILADRLPPLLKGEEKDGAPKVRRQDYLLVEPYTSEVRYHIVPPPGYQAQPLPKSGKTELGAMAISKEFRLESDGSVTAVLRLDTGKRRITAAEFEAARKGVKLLKDQDIDVAFEQVGHSLLAAGKVREALAEFRRLSSLHPKEALHHCELANVLLQLGLQGAARKEAERAVDLEPDSHVAHRILGWVLEHDQLGRLRGKGFDRKRALAEYRKAKTLNADDFAARGALAILLEFDEEGIRYSRKADLAGAIDEYYAMRASKYHDLDDNLLASLYHAQRWKELKSLSQSLKPSDLRYNYLLAAIAVEDGAPAAIKEARLISDAATRQGSLQGAASFLVNARRYREGADLFEAVAKGSASAASLSKKIALLRKVQPYEQVIRTAKGPSSVIKRMLASVVVPESAPDTFLSVFARVVREDVENGPDKEFIRGLRFTGDEAESSRLVQADAALSTVDFRMEGSDDTAYRIDASLPGIREGIALRAFVIHEEGQYRILCSSATPEVLGAEALRRLEMGELEGAMTLLEWAREELSSQERGTPAAQAFLKVWTADSAADPERMRLAAATLLLDTRDKEVVPLLLERRRSADQETAKVIDYSLLAAYLARKQYPELLRHSQNVAEAYPLSSDAFVYGATALRAMDRWKEMRNRAEERLRKVPDDEVAVRILADCAAQAGEYEESAKLYKRLDHAGTATPTDYNELAWLGLFRKRELPESVAFAERAVSLTEEKSAGLLHTLAALYAEAGKTSEARETILKSVAARQPATPTPVDWYVMGRIAEAYGEMEEAKEDYAKVTEPDKETVPATSTYLLARKRLAQQ